MTNVPNSTALSGASSRILPLAPLSFFAMTLGFAETGNAWRWATESLQLSAIPGEILQGLAVVSCAWWLLLYLNKWISYRAQAVSELRDPVQASFFALLPESLLLTALSLAPYVPEFALITFWVGSLLNILYASIRLSRFWVSDRSKEHTTPSMHLVYTASVLVNSLAAAHFGYMEFAWILFGMGAISWLILDSVITDRLFTAGLDVRFRNFMGIYMAPSAVAFVAYQEIAKADLNLIVVYALLGYAVFTAVTVVFSLAWLRQQAFAPGYWAYTFGMSTLTQGFLMLYRSAPNPWLYYSSIVLLTLSTVLLLYVLIGTISMMVQRKYYPVSS
ncbi:SLAC1 family transporter [Stappia indica]|uniref:SLAC1 family transporter n=1 Tax=Stappia indica TaxID=538381 RepID=UPI001CD7F80D|nr:hypothetical protein [Stappia indica]MCA1298811.1 hypothetical protein [Stappia indica]